MRVAQLSWSDTAGWANAPGDRSNANLVFFFGARQALACGARYQELRAMFPDAHILGCSTGGQINNDDVTDDEIAAAAIRFDTTQLRVACEPASSPEGSRACGGAIGRALAAPDLAGIFVLSDGLNVNGSELVAGITGAVGKGVSVTGGLAGDGADFRETLVGADCAPCKHVVGAVGFYGPAIRIGHGSAGGWDEFGPRRQITRSVSYTHLIVQTKLDWAREFGATHGVNAQGENLTRAVLELTDGVGAVSYTHLDVYKRQALVVPRAIRHVRHGAASARLQSLSRGLLLSLIHI